MQQILHQSAGSGCLEAHRHTALLLLAKLPHRVLIWLPYPAPGGKQSIRTGSTPKTKDMTPAAAEIACAVQELSFHRAPEIYTSAACKRSEDLSDRSGVSREIKKHTQTNLSVFWQGQ